jgi:hypothetical protein
VLEHQARLPQAIALKLLVFRIQFPSDEAAAEALCNLVRRAAAEGRIEHDIAGAGSCEGAGSTSASGNVAKCAPSYGVVATVQAERLFARTLSPFHSLPLFVRDSSRSSSPYLLPPKRGPTAFMLPLVLPGNRSLPARSSIFGCERRSFPSKEDLIEAVLRLYSEGVVHELFDPVAHISDPREQIIEFFDVRKVTGRVLTRGCLGTKAAQEYAGKHEGIVELGIAASSRGEVKFLELCKRAGFAKPQCLAKQLNLLLQGALALSHASGETSAFMLAKDVASAVLENAPLVQPTRSGS